MATISQSVQKLKSTDDLALPPLPDRKLTFDEFFDWCRGYEKIRVEWVDGEVVIMSPVDIDHCRLKNFLSGILRIFAEEHDHGLVFGSMFICRLQTETREVARMPDIFFLAADRSNLLKPTYLDAAPDLVIEIVSPDSIDRDYREKYHDYESGGVREYWLIDPLSNQMKVWTRGAESGKFQPLLETNGQFSSTVLPGFFLRPEWLWREPLPKVMEILRVLRV